MTPPRQVIAGDTFEVISRCVHRLFLLAPCPKVRETFLYILGVYAKKYAIQLFALVIMSNHYHLLGKDIRGNLPDFVRDLNAFVARVLNAHRGVKGKFWAGDGYHIVKPVNPEDVWARLMYITSNPINADLVSRTQDFPGFVTTPSRIGKTFTAERPDFFREGGVMPETAELTFEVPECFGLSKTEYVARFDRALRDAEHAAKQRRRTEGKSVVGVKALRNVRHTQMPRSREKWFKTKGHIACKCEESRKAAIAARNAFLNDYREAREEWAEDVSGVVFPHGTWWVCRFAGAPARGAPG